MGNFQKPTKKEPKKDLPSKASASTSTSKKKSKDADEVVKMKRQKKKKDPNAPKRGMSGFMFFSQMEREVCFMLYIYQWCRFGFGCVEMIISLLQDCLTIDGEISNAFSFFNDRI